MTRGELSAIATRATVALAASAALALACGGSDSPAGEIAGARRPAPARDADASAPAPAAFARQILFGDLHVHTTYSIDAFLYGLPLFGGEGAHPPADACDFARYCAELDFFSLNDHAEGLLAPRWRRSIESLRECDARAGDPADPDLVAFAGWEWTQTSPSPEDHFGHKNVIFPGLADDALPARPISALGDDVMSRARHLWLVRGAEALAGAVAPEYADFLGWVRALAETPICEPGVDTRELPPDCHETASDPAVLFEKLAQWGHESLVIPHGLTWGIHAPPGATLAHQLTRERHDGARQRLLEVYSGHGAAERFDAAAARADAAARAGECAPPSDDFLPCCWQAGEIVRAHCDAPGSDACEAAASDARRLALAAGRRPHQVLPEARVEEWLDCDQPRGAFKPALAPRPGQSAQATLALESRDAAGAPLRFRFGLIGSSDTHTARAGSGYKQVRRRGMTDARGFASERTAGWLAPWVRGESAGPATAVPAPPAELGFRGLLDVERTASFLYPGGLVAVHAPGRDRRSVWDALLRREVYGTSGPRILLWFDLVNGPEGRAPMGASVVAREAPRFEVRAVGALAQRPGCRASTHAALGDARVASLCLGECHHPSDTRHRIDAIEVVRIRPGAAGDDPADLAARIDDPWLRFECPPDPAGCAFAFADPDFGADDRVYYVRALQEPTPAINGANLRTRRDADGRALGVTPCAADWRGDPDDDCLAPVRERAWSSPIFVDAPRSGGRP